LSSNLIGNGVAVAIWVLLFTVSKSSSAWSNTICNSNQEQMDPNLEKSIPSIALKQTLTLDKPVTAIAWSPDGNLIATSELRDSVIKIWSVRTAAVLHTIYKRNFGSNTLLFTPDGKQILTSSIDGFDGVNRTALSIIDVSSGNIVGSISGWRDPKNFPLANEPANSIFSPDGRILYIKFNSDPLLHYYNTTTWAEAGRIALDAFAMTGGPNADEITMVVLEPSTDMRPGPLWHGVPTMVADQHAKIAIWSGGSERVVQEFALTPPLIPGSMALDPSACLLFVSGRFMAGQAPIRVWNLQSGLEQGRSSASLPTMRSMSLSHNGRWLAVAGNNGEVSLIGALDFAPLQVIHRFDDYAWRVEFSPDDGQLAIAGDKSVLIYGTR
jgi:WD40 repeat protein